METQRFSPNRRILDHIVFIDGDVSDDGGSDVDLNGDAIKRNSVVLSSKDAAEIKHYLEEKANGGKTTIAKRLWKRIKNNNLRYKKR